MRPGGPWLQRWCVCVIFYFLSRYMRPKGHGNGGYLRIFPFPVPVRPSSAKPLCSQAAPCRHGGASRWFGGGSLFPCVPQPQTISFPFELRFPAKNLSLPCSFLRRTPKLYQLRSIAPRLPKSVPHSAPPLSPTLPIFEKGPTIACACQSDWPPIQLR